MENKWVFTGVLAVSVSLFGAEGIAQAQDKEAPATPAAAPAAPAEGEKMEKGEKAGQKPIFEGFHLSFTGELLSRQVVLLGWNFDELLFAVGGGFKFDPNGITPTGAMMPSTDKVTGDFVFAVSYMLHDKGPLAFGPEVVYITAAGPGLSAFSDYNEIDPGVAFWVLPWKAPVLIGTAVQLPLKFIKGLPNNPSIESIQPDLRLIWAFY